MHYLTRPYLLIPGICTAIIGGLFYWGLSIPTPEEPLPHEQRSVVQAVIGEEAYTLEVRSTPEERAAGLSNYVSLEPNTGLVFVFDALDTHRFWMKDMHFAIDILWLNEDKEVVYVVKNALPDSYPEVFTPPTPARYVVEIPGGEYYEGSNVDFVW